MELNLLLQTHKVLNVAMNIFKGRFRTSSQGTLIASLKRLPKQYPGDPMDTIGWCSVEFGLCDSARAIIQSVRSGIALIEG